MALLLSDTPAVQQDLKGTLCFPKGSPSGMIRGFAAGSLAFRLWVGNPSPSGVIWGLGELLLVMVLLVCCTSGMYPMMMQWTNVCEIFTSWR